jgi:hypothetical protein
MCIRSGCQKMSALKEMAGLKFGKLTVIKRVGRNCPVRWRVRCECGREKTVEGSHLRRGDTVSCGRRRGKTHGLSGAYNAENKIWSGMKTRCYNPNSAGFKFWGGRNIKVCKRWLGPNGFENFLKDMGPRPSSKHSLDRYPDGDGDYEPSNCRWATRIEQVWNGRK